MRTLDDAIEKVIGMLLAGELDLRVQVDSAPVPALRDDPVEDCSGPMLIIDPRQENAEFGRDTGPGLLLQAALAQHAFEQSLAFHQACRGDAGGQTMSKLALKCRLPASAMPVLRRPHDHCRGLCPRRRAARPALRPHQGRRASTVGPRTAPRAPFHRTRDRARYRYYDLPRAPADRI